MDKYNCHCGMTIECPIKKREIRLKHSAFTHLLAKEIHLYDTYSKYSDILTLDTLRDTIIEDKETIKKTLWSLVYTEKNFLENKNKCIGIISNGIDDKNRIKNMWKDWYIRYGSQYYNLAKNTYPQIGTIFITDNAI